MSAVVERRKASALRSARGRAEHGHGRCAFSALRLPLFFWRQKIRGFGLQNSGAYASRGRDRLFFTLPCRGRVAHRRCAGWGAGRCRESQRACALSHPNPPSFAIADALHRRSLRKVRQPRAACGPSPSRGRWKKVRICFPRTIRATLQTNNQETPCPVLPPISAICSPSAR